MSGKHTPTPWLYDYRGEQAFIYVEDAQHICSGLTPANAQHIVKCVNAHDELVKMVQRYIDTGFTYRYYKDDMPVDIRSEARVLLDRLKGGE